MNSQSNSQNHLKPDEMMLPMLKHQATSPNLPLNELTCNDDEVCNLINTIVGLCVFLLIHILFVAGIIKNNHMYYTANNRRGSVC